MAGMTVPTTTNQDILNIVRSEMKSKQCTPTNMSTVGSKRLGTIKGVGQVFAPDTGPKVLVILPTWARPMWRWIAGCMRRWIAWPLCLDQHQWHIGMPSRDPAPNRQFGQARRTRMSPEMHNQ